MYFHLWKSISRCSICHAILSRLRQRTISYAKSTDALHVMAAMEGSRQRQRMPTHFDLDASVRTAIARPRTQITPEKWMLLPDFRSPSKPGLHYIDWNAVVASGCGHVCKRLANLCAVRSEQQPDTHSFSGSTCLYVRSSNIQTAVRSYV